MRTVDAIIVHCADTPVTMDIGYSEIRHWHVDLNGWNDVGYHFIIRRDGTVENGRDIDVPGAHAKGHNSKSIGVCLVGGKGADGAPEANFTLAQYQTLNALVARLRHEHGGDIKVIGHRDVSEKACPSFNVQALLGE